MELTTEELTILDALLRRHRLTRPMDEFLKNEMQENLQAKLDSELVDRKKEVPNTVELLGPLFG